MTEEQFIIIVTYFGVLFFMAGAMFFPWSKLFKSDETKTPNKMELHFQVRRMMIPDHQLLFEYKKELKQCMDSGKLDLQLIEYINELEFRGVDYE